MTKYTLFIGLNDKDTRRQIIKTDAAGEMIREYCFEYLNGATVQNGAGIYKHDDGEKIVENTFIVIVNDYAETEKDAVLRFAAAVKKALNQESVLLTAEPLTTCNLI